MATSPTVLANGPSSASSSTPLAPAPAEFPIASLLITVVASVSVAMLGVGGGLYYLARSGRLPMFAGAAHKPEAAAPSETHVLALEPMLVNLADQGGSSYLRVSLTLRVADAEKSKTSAKERASKENKGEAVAPVRDTLLNVLGRQTSDELLDPNGKEHLKTALKSALAEHDPELKVADVYITDFLVQR